MVDNDFSFFVVFYLSVLVYMNVLFVLIEEEDIRGYQIIFYIQFVFCVILVVFIIQLIKEVEFLLQYLFMFSIKI